MRINGSGFTVGSPAPTGDWGFTTGVLRVGAAYPSNATFRGTPRAIVFFNVKVSDSVATKLYKWSQQRHGVA
jgi:hypothetical protein